MLRLLWVVFALAGAALLATGCGGSDKPAYCSNVSDLQQSVNDLRGVKLERGALSTLQTDLKKVQSNANAVVSSAKEDFPSQTSALKSSVSSLSTAVSQLPTSLTGPALAALVPMVRSVVTAANGLKSATSSACD